MAKTKNLYQLALKTAQNSYEENPLHDLFESRMMDYMKKHPNEPADPKEIIKEVHDGLILDAMQLQLQHEFLNHLKQIDPNQDATVVQTQMDDAQTEAVKTLLYNTPKALIALFPSEYLSFHLSVKSEFGEIDLGNDQTDDEPSE